MTARQKWPTPTRTASDAALPGRIIRRHWPPPDGADNWQPIGQVAARVLGMAPERSGEAV